jgi:LysM repeat protein
MKKYAALILLILTALSLSACRMSASTPPPETPTTNLSEIARQATQTAIAKTPKAGDADETPAADPTQGDPTAAPAEETDQPEPTPEPTQKPASGEAPTYAVPDSYTIHEGEFPFCLARRFNINIDDLLNYNGLSDNSILYPGDVIQIPESARPFNGQRALRSHPTTYTVQSGESLYAIACKFGDVDPRAIAQVNDLSLNQQLTPGTTIQIP